MSDPFTDDACVLADRVLFNVEDTVEHNLTLVPREELESECIRMGTLLQIERKRANDADTRAEVWRVAYDGVRQALLKRDATIAVLRADLKAARGVA